MRHPKASERIEGGHSPRCSRLDKDRDCLVRDLLASDSVRTMREREIRTSLRRQLVAEYGMDLSALILDELGICSGQARVDMAVVNGELKGFEIKSDQDTLARLPTQSHMYGKVFDTMTIVVGPRHLERVESLAPHWWGIVLAVSNKSRVGDLQVVRPECTNIAQDAASLVQLLWRDEVIGVLCAIGMVKGLRSRPRKYLWEVLASSLCLEDLRCVVRRQLKLRRNWRVASERMRDDGRSLLYARW